MKEVIINHVQNVEHYCFVMKNVQIYSCSLRIGFLECFVMNCEHSEDILWIMLKMLPEKNAPIYSSRLRIVFLKSICYKLEDLLKMLYNNVTNIFLFSEKSFPEMFPEKCFVMNWEHSGRLEKKYCSRCQKEGSSPFYPAFYFLSFYRTQVSWSDLCVWLSETH